MAGFDQIGAVWSLFDFIIGGGDSAEIKEMREQFRKTNVKIERLDNKVDEQTNILLNEIRTVESNDIWGYLTTIIEAYDGFAKNREDPTWINRLIRSDSTEHLSKALNRMLGSIGTKLETQIERYAKCPKAFDDVLWVSGKLARLLRAATLGCNLHMRQNQIPAAQAKKNCQSRETRQKVQNILDIMQQRLERLCTKTKALDRAYMRMQREEVVNSADSFSVTSEKVYNMLNEDFPEYAWLVGVFPGTAQSERGIVSPERHRLLENWAGRNVVIFMITPFWFYHGTTGKKTYLTWDTLPNACKDSENRVKETILSRIPTDTGSKWRSRLDKWGHLIMGTTVNPSVRFAAYRDKWKQAKWKGSHCKLSHPWGRGFGYYDQYEWVWAF